MVGADPGGDRQLQVRRLGDPLGGQVGGPEGLRDHHLGVGQVLVELGVLAVLVGGDDQLVARGLEELAQAELAGDAARAARPGVKSIASGVGVLCPSG